VPRVTNDTLKKRISISIHCMYSDIARMYVNRDRDNLSKVATRFVHDKIFKRLLR